MSGAAPDPLKAFRNFKPAGPVSAAYIADRASRVKALLGPVGGGKSVANVYDKLRRPALMPACNDGIIRYRCAIIGATYGQIERNLYPTWWQWLPKDTRGDAAEWVDTDWQGGGGRFATHKLRWNALTGNRLVEIRAEYIFAAVGDLAVEDFMRGFEPTEFWLYEADLLPSNLLAQAVLRIGRFPRTGDEPDAVRADRWSAFRPQIGCDLNAPDTDSWFYKLFEEDPPDGYRVYKQSSGRSARAENLQHLRPGYYQDQVIALSRQPGGRNLVKRMVDAQYAPSSAGEPVYPEYDDAVHLAPQPLKPVPGVPLELGFDQGLGQPAAVIGQSLASGQQRILAEVVPGRMSARRFAACVREKLLEIAPGHPLADVHWCDPAGFTGADREDGESAWAEIVARELGIAILPCETNEIDLRLTAVVDDLTYIIEPGVPAFLLSPECRMLRKGFVSHYMFDKRPDEKTQSRKPVKNLWSNPHDALQYRQLGRKGRFGVIAGPRDARAAERQYNPDRRARAEQDTGCHVLSAPVEI